MTRLVESPLSIEPSHGRRSSEARKLRKESDAFECGRRMNFPCYDSFALERAPGIRAKDPSGVASAIGLRLFHAEVSGRGILGVSERFDLSVSPQQSFQLEGRSRLRLRLDESRDPSATQCGRRLQSDSLGVRRILPATPARITEASLS